jgi:SAM-dependent methyltransferase
MALALGLFIGCAGKATQATADSALATAQTPASKSAMAGSGASAPTATGSSVTGSKPVYAVAADGATFANYDRKPVFDVPYWPTPQPVVEKMLELAKVKASDVIYDLGCGDARSLVTAAKRHGAKGIGIEIDVRLVRLARENARRNGVEHLVEIELRDMFTVDLSNADVVFLYLLDRTLVRLMPQLAKVRPASRIVAHEYALPDVTPNRTVQFLGPPDGPPGSEDGSAQKTHTLYLWMAPLGTLDATHPAVR